MRFISWLRLKQEWLIKKLIVILFNCNISLVVTYAQPDFDSNLVQNIVFITDC